jgi:integrase
MVQCLPATKAGQMAKTGRKQKPYETSWGEIVPGLNRQPDGRWRNIDTGARFTETDERLAVNKYKRWKAANQTAEMVRLPIASHDNAAYVGSACARAMTTQEFRITVRRDHTAPITASRTVPGAEVWGFLREQLISNPEHVARMVDIPQIAQLRHMNLPKPSIRLTEIITNYQTENASTAGAKRAALRAFNRFLEHTTAKTLADLTKDKIHAFRQSIEKDKNLKSAGTRKHMYGQIKSIISFGLKNPVMDAAEIRATLDRTKLLWTPEPMPSVDPKPISRSDFHRLLDTATAERSTWRAWLLLGLNAAMYIGELCILKWESIDLDHGTLAMIRNKTRRGRIPKVATLWPETIAALRALPQKPTYVFTSPHGTRYGTSQSRANAFADFRKRAGLTDAVSFSHLKDGAYGAACEGTTDERLARLLAGHKAPGLLDNYVLRNPSMVRPACDAVYKVYMAPLSTTPR